MTSDLVLIVPDARIRPWFAPARTIGLLTLLLSVLLPLSAVAQGQTTTAALIQEPSFEQILEAWPAHARAVQVGGDVDLGCTVSPEGRLEGCRVRAESAPDRGFGAAALVLAGLYRYRPATRDGAPVASQVAMRVRFECRGRCRPFQRPRDFKGPMVAVGWLTVPSAAQVAAAYPTNARQAGLSGVVTLFCRLDPHGRLIDCASVGGFPRDSDFVGAALSLAPFFRAPEKLSDGRAIAGAGVLVPIAFLVDPSAVRRPPLSRVPTYDAFGAAYPPAALDARVVSGVGTVRCRVGESGALNGCGLVGETPAGLGFGAAALSLAPQFSVVLWSPDGKPSAGDQVQLPIQIDAPLSALQAGDAGGPPFVVTRPDWAARPSPRDVDLFYPERAQQSGQTGNARIRCRVNTNGSVRECVVVTETPPGYGFGEAAVRMSPLFRMKPQTVDGRPVGGAVVYIEVRFR